MISLKFRSLVPIAVSARFRSSMSVTFEGLNVPVTSWLLLFARDPFLDVRGAVSEFDASRFAECQQVHRTALDQADLAEIDGDRAAFLIDRGTEDLSVLLRNSSADAQHHKIPLNLKSVDSAGHRGLALSWQTGRHSQTIEMERDTGRVADGALANVANLASLANL